MEWNAHAQSVDLEDHLALRLRFDGNTDVEPEGFHVSVENAEFTKYSQDAVQGEALDLSLSDGNPDVLTGPDIHYLQILRPPEIEEHFSISFWFKLSDGRQPLTHQGIFSWGSTQNIGLESHGIGVVDNGDLIVWINSHSETGWHQQINPGEVDFSEWTHVAYSFSTQSKELRLHLNGALILEQEYIHEIDVTGLPIFLGSNPWGNFETFHGFLDDFRLYDKPLDSNEILGLFQEFVPPNETPISDENGLVLRMRMNGDISIEPETYFTAVTGHVEYSENAIDESCLNLTGGNGGYVSIINPPQIEDHFTISMWIKLPEGDPEFLRGVFSWGPESSQGSEAHGFFVSEFQEFLTIQNFNDPWNTSTTTPYGKIDVSAWNHVAYTYSAKDREHSLYVNGKPIVTTRAVRPIRPKGQNILIGVNPIGGHEIFPGLIDDFRLYDKPLTQIEVQSLIDEQIPSLSIERIEQGNILSINNPKMDALQILATSDFEIWESVYVTGTSKTQDFFFDNGHQDDSQRFYFMRKNAR